jgi:hypothetical protein
MANLYNVPLKNAVQKTLAGTLTQAETGTITLDSSVALELQASSTMKGILVIDRLDVNGVLTPTKTEYISFTGVSGSTVTGLTRGLAGTSAQGHSIGAIVEFVPDVTWAQAINDVFTTQHNDDGTHKTLASISLASTTLLNTTAFNMSIASGSFTNGYITNVSLASATIYDSKFDGLTINTTTITGASLVSTTFVNRTFIPVAYRTINSTATSTFDLSLSNIFSYTLSAATTTLAFSNPVAGQAVILRLGQDSTGGRRVIFPSTTLWSGGTAPALTSLASKTDVFGFLCTASGFYDGYIVGQNL